MEAELLLPRPSAVCRFGSQRGWRRDSRHTRGCTTGPPGSGARLRAAAALLGNARPGGGARGRCRAYDHAGGTHADNKPPVIPEGLLIADEMRAIATPRRPTTAHWQIDGD